MLISFAATLATLLYQCSFATMRRTKSQFTPLFSHRPWGFVYYHPKTNIPTLFSREINMSMGITAFYSDSRRLKVPEVLSMMEINYAPKPNYNQEHYEPPDPEPEPQASRGHFVRINVSQIHPKIERYFSLHFSIFSTLSFAQTNNTWKCEASPS